MKYRPLGTGVLLKVIPIEEKPLIQLPEGKQDTRIQQSFKVMAVGGQVNTDTYKLAEGEVVYVAAHQAEIFPVDAEEKLLIVDRSKIVVALTEEPSGKN